MTKPIIVGYDGSSASDLAVRWAAEEATSRGLPLRVICVWTLPPTDVGIGSGAESFSELTAQLNLNGCVAQTESLGVRVADDEVDARQLGSDHRGDRVAAAAADSDHYDPRGILASTNQFNRHQTTSSAQHRTPNTHNDTEYPSVTENATHRVTMRALSNAARPTPAIHEATKPVRGAY